MAGYFPVGIPDGWQRCDGSRIVRGRWANKRTPNLNGAGDSGRFLRGGTDTEQNTFQDDAVEDHDHDISVNVQINDPGHSHSYNEMQVHGYRGAYGIDKDDDYYYYRYDQSRIMTNRRLELLLKPVQKQVVLEMAEEVQRPDLRT